MQWTQRVVCILEVKRGAPHRCFWRGGGQLIFCRCAPGARMELLLVGRDLRGSGAEDVGLIRVGVM